MSLVLFVIGFAMASLDLIIGSVDILPDIAGFILILLGLVPVFSARKLKAVHCIWPLLALLCSIALLFLPDTGLSLLLSVLRAVSLFLLVLFLSRVFFPERPKDSTDSILFQSMLTAHFFLMISKLFAGLLGSVELIGILILLFQILILIFEIVIVCRHWPARPIQ